MLAGQRSLILREAANWQREGVIDAEAYQRIVKHYSGAARGADWRAIILLSIGALLTGLGIIALLAANWDQLARPIRAAVAMLLPGVCAGAWLVGWGREWAEKRAFLEPLGIIWMLSIGAAIALISQTYQISGSFSGFMLAWTLLTLPVLYGTLAMGPALGFFIGLFVWVCVCAERGTNSQAYWLMAPLAVPALMLIRAAAPEGIRFKVALWIGVLVSTTALGFTLEKALPGIWMIVYSGLFAALLAGGLMVEPADAPSIWQTPMRTLGGAGQAVLLYLLTFHWPWEHIGGRFWHAQRYEAGWQLVFDFTLAVVLPLLALVLSVVNFKRLLRRQCGVESTLVKRVADLCWSLAPLLVALLFYAVDKSMSGINVVSLVMTGALAALALLTLAVGLVQRSLRWVNGGVLVLLAVIVGKFFAEYYSFTARGLVFVVCGLLFFAVNWTASRFLRRTA